MSDDVTESIEIFNPESRVLFGVTVEIPRGIKNRYKMDHLTDRVRLNRTLFASAQYPYDYGLIEGTLGLDDNPLDAMVIGTEFASPGCLIQCYAVAIFRMTDEMGGDDKVLCVLTADARRRHLKDLDSMAEHILLEIEHFFSVYKDLGPDKSIEGATWAGHKEAEEEVTALIERAKDTPFKHHHTNLA